MIGHARRSWNRRPAEKHGQIAPTADRRLELTEVGGGDLRRLLEEPAEIQLVAEADLSGDLLDRPERVQELPLRMDEDAAPDQVGGGGAEVLPDDPPQGMDEDPAEQDGPAARVLARLSF